tara:strand:+ start:8450 stop:8812 length:363 start_codon:yes stop_codon:yes gene_type:complete
MMVHKNSPEKPPRRGRPPGSKNKKNSKHIDDDISPALESALAEYLDKQTAVKSKSINNLKSLEGLLRQYLNSFILLGYTQDNQRLVNLISASSEQNADSLSTALNKFVINNTKHPPHPTL